MLYLKKSRVHREVGEDAFNYGFLIGDQDLIGDIIGDIYVTFLHRNIQEFFGTFFFVLLLNLSGYHADTPITIKAEAIHEANSRIH